MKEFFINNFIPVLWTAITTFLIVIIKGIVPHFISLIVAKLAILEQNLKQSGHEEELQIAKEIWHIVEENFRIKETVSEIVETKAESFNKLLLEKVPGLTQDEIDYLRQTIAGEVNGGKEALISKDTLISQFNEEKAKLEAENTSLKEQLSTIKSSITVNTDTSTGTTANTVQA